MSEFGSEVAGAEESPEPGNSSGAAAAEAPSESTVKEAVASEAEGSILSKGVTSEGMSATAVENAAADTIHQEIARDYGDSPADASAAVGSIRTENLHEAQADIHQARTRAGNDAAAADSGASEMPGYSPYGNDYSQLNSPAAPMENPTAEPGIQTDSSAWEMNGYTPQAEDYSTLNDMHATTSTLPQDAPGDGSTASGVRDEFRDAAREITSGTADAGTDTGQQSDGGTDPAQRSDGGTEAAQPSDSGDEEEPVRNAKNSRLMHEIRPGGPGEPGTVVYNSRR